MNKQRLISISGAIYSITIFMLVFETRSMQFGNKRISASISNLTKTTIVPDKQLHNNQSVSVVSYSLYGNESIYVRGMIQTAKQAYLVYPDWELRVYHDEDVPSDILRTLASLKNVRLVDVIQEFPQWVANQVHPRSWRFLVASDPAVEIYVVRDADSRPSI